MNAVSVLEKSVWVSCVSLGGERGERKLGKGGMVDMTIEGGRHALGMLQKRRSAWAAIEGGPHEQAGATGLAGAAPVLPPNPACLVLLLSSPGLSRQRVLVVTGMALPCLVAAGQGSTAGSGVLSRK